LDGDFLFFSETESIGLEGLAMLAAEMRMLGCFAKLMISSSMIRSASFSFDYTWMGFISNGLAIDEPFFFGLAGLGTF
jgi:hypothetical protein